MKLESPCTGFVDSVISISLSLKPNADQRLAPAHLPAAVQAFARAGQGLAPAPADRRGAAEELGLGDAGIGRSPRGSGVAQGRNRRQRRRGDGARGACASAGDAGRNRRGVPGARAKDIAALRKDASELLERWSRLSRRSFKASGRAEADPQSAGRALPPGAPPHPRTGARARRDRFLPLAVERRGRTTGGATRAPRSKRSGHEIHHGDRRRNARRQGLQEEGLGHEAPARRDRMASAWLIRRAIDPNATFVFRTKPRGSEIPFDMYTGDFGHHGERSAPSKRSPPASHFAIRPWRRSPRSSTTST